MLTRVQRLAYRLAAPVVQAAWFVLGTRHDGVRCVICRPGEVLLVRHTYGDRRRWDFPGGFVRRGEEPAAAGRRELAEELGLALEPGDLRDLGSVSARGRRRGAIHHFRIDLDGRTPVRDPVELAQIAWFPTDGLPPRVGEEVGELVERVAATPAASTPLR